MQPPPRRIVGCVCDCARPLSRLARWLAGVTTTQLANWKRQRPSIKFASGMLLLSSATAAARLLQPLPDDDDAQGDDNEERRRVS